MINSKGYRIKAGSVFLCLLLPLIMLWGCGGPAQEAVPESAVSFETAFTQSDTAAEPEQETLLTPEPASESAPPPEIRLVMVGDILLHTPLAESGKQPEGGYHWRGGAWGLRLSGL